MESYKGKASWIVGALLGASKIVDIGGYIGGVKTFPSLGMGEIGVHIAGC